MEQKHKNKVKYLFVMIFRSFWVRYFLCKHQWYRRWYGGRWEYHFIDVCTCSMWLNMKIGWPRYRQPCSCGIPKIEQYKNKEIDFD